MTLEWSIPYRMDESCNFRTLTLTPFSKISLNKSGVKSHDSGIVHSLAIWPFRGGKFKIMAVLPYGQAFR